MADMQKQYRTLCPVLKVFRDYPIGIFIMGERLVLNQLWRSRALRRIYIKLGSVLFLAYLSVTFPGPGGHAQNGVSGRYTKAIFEPVPHEESEIWTRSITQFYHGQV